MSNVGEDDVFWSIALNHGSTSEKHVADWKTAEEDDENINIDSKPKVYQIPSLSHKADKTGTSTTVLKLCPLPQSDGVWSPVGADAWYSSALLAVLLLMKGSGEARHPFSKILSRSRSYKKSSINTILELGSGAVGLSGFVCALALGDTLRRQRSTAEWKVLLTDNNDAVLHQLRQNHVNNSSILNMAPSINIQVEVASWEWDNDRPSHGLRSEDEVVLVIGSELVYTKDTAEACVKLLLRLLNSYPDTEIWIVQVSDRFGWREIVVPTLEKSNIYVESIGLSAELHDLASSLVQLGGTLDRHAYGAFCIHNLEYN